MEGYPIYTLDGFRARMDQDLAYIEDFDNHADALDNSQRKIKYWEITTTIISLVSGLIAVIYSYLNPTTSMGLYSLAFLLPFYTVSVDLDTFDLNTKEHTGNSVKVAKPTFAIPGE